VVPVRAKGDGGTYRFNRRGSRNQLTAYITWSRGFRPGGINRRADVANYGLITSPISNRPQDHAVRWPAAPQRRIYQQNWKNFQFAYLGANSFTEIHNGPDARIRGVDIDANVVRAAHVELGGAYTDAKTTKNLCAVDDLTFTCSGSGQLRRRSCQHPPADHAEVEAGGTLRYRFRWARPRSMGRSTPPIKARRRPTCARAMPPAGQPPAFTQVNAAGREWDKYSLEIFVSNASTNAASCRASLRAACATALHRAHHAAHHRSPRRGQVLMA
jgi:hypothetical protein